jgi:hypothetical protein
MGLFGKDGGFDGARAALEKNRQLFEQIALPEYKTFNPELYDNESYNHQLINEDPVVKAA